MTAVSAPPGYLSGWCGSGSHDRCRGLYAGVTCQCACGHRPAEPEPVDLMAELALIDDIDDIQPAPHCPTCSCGDPR